MASEKQIFNAAAKVMDSTDMLSIGTRYVPEEFKLSLWLSMVQFFNGLFHLKWNWSRVGIKLVKVDPGDLRYESAPYEMNVIWDRKANMYFNPK